MGVYIYIFANMLYAYLEYSVAYVNFFININYVSVKCIQYMLGYVSELVNGEQCHVNDCSLVCLTSWSQMRLYTLTIALL